MTAIAYDFRSDTVTKPSPAMRAAMAAAEVGDDVFGDDPSVIALEQRAAQMLAKDAALYVSSGTQSNLLALMSHCGRGDEYISGQQAHLYRWEQGGAAVLGSIQPQPLENQADGSIALEDIEAAIKHDDPHFARTRLVALENTIGGKVLSMDYMRAATDLARSHDLATHLDGARLFNAVTVLGVPVSEVAALFTTVSVCLSKGLGAPVGSVLVGDAKTIATARRLRKMLGGGMRQAGLIAAAGLYALENNVKRLADDHANARVLAEGLSRFQALSVAMPQTNILWVDVAEDVAGEFGAYLEGKGVAVTNAYSGRKQRWVTHLDADRAAVDGALEVVGAFFKGR